jgi:hypothetical protein
VVLMVVGTAAVLAGRLIEWTARPDPTKKGFVRPPIAGPAAKVLLAYQERVGLEKDAAGRAEARKEAERRLIETGLTPAQAALALDELDRSEELPKVEEKDPKMPQQ